MKKEKILLQGYIGHGNFGDDLLFEVAIENIKKIDNIEVSVFVSEEIDADYLLKYFEDLKIIKFRGSVPILSNFKFDKVYFIGGGVFFDYKKSMGKLAFAKKYVSTFIRYRIPYFFGTRYSGNGIGIGPYFCRETEKLHSLVYNSFDVFGVRDKSSFELAQKNGAGQCELANDLSLLYKNYLSDLSSSYSVTSIEVIICPRLYSHNKDYEIHLDELLVLSEYLEKENYRVHWVFLQTETKELFDKINNKEYQLTVWNSKEMIVSNFFDVFNSAEFVITSRMHAVYVAGMLKKKIIPIEVHPKLRYSNRLFYSDKNVLSPLAKQEKYIKAFKSEFDYDNTDLINEQIKTNELNISIINWLKN
jgi:polysaccharide pyruvyl transferase WcaK-like protein